MLRAGEMTQAQLRGAIEILRRQPKFSGGVAYHADRDMGIRYYLRKFRADHPQAKILQCLQGSQLAEYRFRPGTCVFFYAED